MNATSIFALPREDTWPSLTFDLCVVPRMEHSYNHLLITFATTHKNVDMRYGWSEWRAKFEALLRTMSWYSANVYLDIESFGRCHFTWKEDMQLAFADFREVSRNPVERWTFSGRPLDDARQ
jgi:hypothetical protein